MDEAFPPGAWDTARLHLNVLGEDRTLCVPLPLGERSVMDLLPAARALCEETTGLAVAKSRAAGRDISCKAGCGACCRFLVAISVVEAQSVAQVVARMPPERQAVIRARFADALRRLEEAGLLDPEEPRGSRSLAAEDHGTHAATLEALGRRYLALQIACPFLEEESCGIHADRPLVCREHHVTTPAERCARVYDEHVERLEPPVRVGEAMARTAARVGDTDAGMIPLVLSLEWSEANGHLVRLPHDGMTLFRTLMAEIERR